MMFSYSLMTIERQGEHPVAFKEIKLTSPAAPGMVIVLDDKEVFHVSSLIAHVPADGVSYEHMGLVGAIVAKRGADGQFRNVPPPAASRIIVPG